MKGPSYHNEGFQVLPEFVCEAIPFPAKPKKPPKPRSKQDSRKPRKDAKAGLKQQPRKAKNGRPQKRNKKEGK